MTVQPPVGLLEVGRCGKPHGVRGKITVRLSSDRRERVQPGARLWIGEWWEDGSSAIVPGSDRWIVGLVGVDDRTTAETFVNRTVWAEPLEDDEAFWVHQIIGAEVRDVHGEMRGRCQAVIANPSNDLLELDTGALIPVPFIESISGSESSGFTVVVDPPAGLFELFDSDSSADGVETRRADVPGEGEGR